MDGKKEIWLDLD